MITKYRTRPIYHSPFDVLMNGVMGHDISQFFGHDDLTTNTPKVNITETPEKFVISLLVPGYLKDQLKITAEKETLTVKGETSETTLNENERYTRHEFKVGSFSRSFHLPMTVDLDAIQAEHVNGVLNITVPRVEPAKPAVRDISIS